MNERILGGGSQAAPVSESRGGANHPSRPVPQGPLQGGLRETPYAALFLVMVFLLVGIAGFLVHVAIEMFQLGWRIL